MKKIMNKIMKTKLNIMLKFLILSVTSLVVSCSEPDTLTDFDFDTDELNGYYLGAVLDSNRLIHSRQFDLNIELQNLSYFSDCLLNNLEFQEFNLSSTSDVFSAWIHLDLEGNLNSNCPIQKSVNSKTFVLSASELPSQDSLIIWGLNGYTEDKEGRFTGPRDSVAVDTILLLNGDYNSSNYLFAIDSQSLPVNVYNRRGVIRALLKDSSAVFEFESYTSQCPASKQNRKCEVEIDTLDFLRYSIRDSIKDSVSVKIKADTLQRVFKKKCQDGANYCNDLETWKLNFSKSDSLVELNQYQTIFIEKLPPCESLNLIQSHSTENYPKSESKLGPSRNYSFERELFVKDSNLENCKSTEHYYGYSYEQDSVFIEQDSLKVLWGLLQDLKRLSDAP